MRRAAAQQSREQASSASSADLPAAPPHPLETDIEALAREASAHDGEREANALALEWPQESLGTSRHGRRAWIGWAALAAAIVLGLAVAAAAVVFTSADEAAPVPAPGDGLKLERQLANPPRAPSRG